MTLSSRDLSETLIESNERQATRPQAAEQLALDLAEEWAAADESFPGALETAA